MDYFKELTDEGYPARNWKTGRFLKGHIPHNRGKHWSDYMDMRKAKRVLRIAKKNLQHGNPNLGGWNKRAVVAVRSDGKHCYFESATKAAESLNLCRRNICLCCHGKRKRCGAFRWFFFEDDAWMDFAKIK